MVIFHSYVSLPEGRLHTHNYLTYFDTVEHVSEVFFGPSSTIPWRALGLHSAWASGSARFLEVHGNHFLEGACIRILKLFDGR